MIGQLADDDLGRRLLSMPCVGPITASLLAVEIGDGQQYGCSRDFAASLGLVPRPYSTGGKANLLGISKQKGALADWVRALMTRRHSNVVAGALANKFARIAWAISAHHT